MAQRIHHWLNIAAVLAVAAAFGLILFKNLPRTDRDTILNVSYDPTRELYERIDPAFAADYARRTGRHIALAPLARFVPKPMLAGLLMLK